MDTTHRKEGWAKYLVVFLITVGIFATIFWVSSTLTNKKVNELAAIQSNISIDLLSSETQYQLLGGVDCTEVNTSILSDQLNDLAGKIEYLESANGKSENLTQLEQQYSLLEIKDYLLMKELTSRCGQKSVFILYFYTSAANCSDCVKQGYVLTDLRAKYPALRVYSFDYSLNLSAVATLEKIYGIKDTELPAIVSGGKVYTGFHTVEDIEALIPTLKSTLTPVTPPAATKGGKATTTTTNSTGTSASNTGAGTATTTVSNPSDGTSVLPANGASATTLGNTQ